MEGEAQHVTAIVSSCLQDQAVLLRIKENGVRVRLSSSVSRKAVIFPVSGVAFRLLSERDLSGQHVPVGEDMLSIGEDLINELKDFASVHRNAFVLVLISEMFNLRVYQELNLIFLQSSLNFIPVPNGEATVMSMLTIAK
uniref:protein SPO16 homolog n=1 Tax=Myxine glutinosa TaxID=7769 RepID=UPI00358F5705